MRDAAIALTGAGVVCAVGGQLSTAWANVCDGVRGARPVQLFDVEGHRSVIAAEVAALHVPVSELGAPWSRTDAMALVAAREAIAAAGLARRDGSKLRLGLVVGGTTGGMFETERLIAEMLTHPARRTADRELLSHPLTATVERLSEALGAFARARTVCSACSSGSNAFVIARAWLRRGDVDAVLVGGTDALCRLTFAGFNALGAIDPDACRPFDVRRRGLTIGEGAGFAIVERSVDARARGAAIWAEIVGVGVASEAHHITNPDARGIYAASAIASALRDAGITASDVDYVNAHGTATPLNDAMESTAIARALGDDVGRVDVSSTKGATGHTLAAAGAIEAIFAALSIRDGRVPPTAGLEQIDPACASLRHVVGASSARDVRVALSSSFGFGGVDTVLAFAKAGHVAPKGCERRAIYVTGIGSASRIGAFTGADNLALFGDAPSVVVDPSSSLDAARARRLDRAGRLATVAADRAGAHGSDGLILGTSYGDADGSAAFVARLLDKGPRMVPPADFPNLVPSSPSGHASIYLGIHGPVLATSDLGVSGEGAIVTAIELLDMGLADAIVAGSLEGPSELVRTSLAPTIAEYAGGSPVPDVERSEGSAAVRLTIEAPADGDAAKIAIVDIAQAARASDLLSMIAATAPLGRGVIVVGERTAPLCLAIAEDAPFGWSQVEVRDVARAVGRNEGLGGFAFAAACALLTSGQVDDAIVLGEAPGRGYAIRARRLTR